MNGFASYSPVDGLGVSVLNLLFFQRFCDAWPLKASMTSSSLLADAGRGCSGAQDAGTIFFRCFRDLVYDGPQQTQGLLSTARQIDKYNKGNAGTRMNGSHLLLQACISTILFAGAANADEVADFYKGKSIEMQIAYTAGGGYDLYARILSRHFGNHIPGKPTIIPKNSPGAGGLRLANWLYSVAPKDGTVLAAIGRTTPFEPLIGPSNSTTSAVATTMSASVPYGTPRASPNLKMPSRGR